VRSRPAWPSGRLCAEDLAAARRSGPARSSTCAERQETRVAVSAVSKSLWKEAFGEASALLEKVSDAYACTGEAAPSAHESVASFQTCQLGGRLRRPPRCCHDELVATRRRSNAQWRACRPRSVSLLRVPLTLRPSAARRSRPRARVALGNSGHVAFRTVELIFMTRKGPSTQTHEWLKRSVFKPNSSDSNAALAGS
jgi:hypothetical protein